MVQGMGKGRLSRAERSGIKTAEAIIEMVNLMYQNKTAKNFYKGFIKIIMKELIRRKIIKSEEIILDGKVHVVKNCWKQHENYCGFVEVAIDGTVHKIKDLQQYEESKRRK